MKILPILMMTLILGTSCSSVSRDPASFDKKNDDFHQKYEGLFNRQD